MSTFSFSTITVSAVLLLATGAGAQKVTETVELAAGGLTIAGPGAQELAVGESVFAIGNRFPDLCVTVANIGKRGTVAIQSVESDGISVRFTVDPLETGTSCYLDSQVSAISFACKDSDPTPGRFQAVEPPPCKFLWRADKSRS